MLRTVVILAIVAAVICDRPSGDITTTTNVVGGSSGGIPVAVSSDGSTTFTPLTTATVATTGACGTGDLSGIDFQGAYEIDYSCSCSCNFGGGIGYPTAAWLDFYWESASNDAVSVQADVDIDFDYYGRTIDAFESSVELRVFYSYSYYDNRDYYSLDTQKSDLCVEGLHFQQSSEHDFAYAINGEWINIGTFKDIQENAIDFCSNDLFNCNGCAKREVVARSEDGIDTRPTLDERVGQAKPVATTTATTSATLNTTEVLHRMKDMGHVELSRTISDLHVAIRSHEHALRKEEDLLQQLKKQRKMTGRKRHFQK